MSAGGSLLKKCWPNRVDGKLWRSISALRLIRLGRRGHVFGTVTRLRAERPGVRTDSASSVPIVNSTMTGRGNGGKGLGNGGAKRHRKVLRDNIQGITKPAVVRLARMGGVKLDLRRDARCAESVLGERNSGCCYTHQTCKAEDCNCYGCCICFEETRTHTVRIWRLILLAKKGPFSENKFN